MKHLPNQMLCVIGGICFALGVNSESDSETYYFSLFCGNPETEFYFIEQVEELDFNNELSIPAVDLKKFDSDVVAEQIHEVYRTNNVSLVIIPINHFSYKGINRIAMGLMHQESLFFGEDFSISWCANYKVLRKLLKEEFLERAMRLEFKEPVA